MKVAATSYMENIIWNKVKNENIPNDKPSRRPDGRQSENGAAFPKRLPRLRIKKINLSFQGFARIRCYKLAADIRRSFRKLIAAISEIYSGKVPLLLFLRKYLGETP